MIIDEELRRKQSWVAARQLKSDTMTTTVYFPTLPEANLEWLQVGDAPPEWKDLNFNQNTPKMPTSDRDVACTARERLELSKEDLLQREIDKVERDLAKLKLEVENPEEAEREKKEKEEKRKKALNQKKWFEYSMAVGGSWLKASTGPPKFDSPLHILQVRDGKVIDVVKTTIARYCHWKTPEYRSHASGPGWMIDIPQLMAHGKTLFEDVQVGDCALVQIQPYHLLPDNAKTPFSAFCTIENSGENDHRCLVDLDVVNSQKKIAALQLTATKSYNTVFFDPLSETKTEIKAGDKLWPSNPTPDASMWEKRDQAFRQQDRQSVLGTTEEKLKSRVEALEKTLQEMKDIRDIPGRREELQEEVRKKNPFVWSDFSSALNGSWIKASTWPPHGDMPVDMLLLRDGQVEEAISATLCKVSKFGPYRGGEYISTGIAMGSPHPGWGVATDTLIASNLFSKGMEIGDCVMLKVPPMEQCEGGEMLTWEKDTELGSLKRLRKH